MIVRYDKTPSEAFWEKDRQEHGRQQEKQDGKQDSLAPGKYGECFYILREAPQGSAAWPQNAHETPHKKSQSAASCSGVSEKQTGELRVEFRPAA